MFIVAITRWGPGLDEQLPALAQQLGLFPYDLRIRLNGPLPVVVARVPERGHATALLAQLHAWGHGAVGCEDSKVVAGDTMLQVREFRFEGERLIVEDTRQVQAELAASEVFMLIHAMALSEQHSTRETTTTKFSAAKAVLSGGLVMSTTTTSTSHATDSSSEERLYLVRRSYTEPMLFCQHQLRYLGLGEAMSRSSHDNFAELTRRLRAFAPHARYDDRLRTTRRKLGFEAANSDQSGKTKTSTVASSNGSGIDVAAHLLVIGHARGQL